MNKALDRVSFEIMFKKYFVPLCHYAQSILGDAEQSKDVVQQSFVKLWQKRNTIDQSRPVKAYLYTSVRNNSINHLRNIKKFNSSILDIEIYEGASFSVSDPDELIVAELADKIKKILERMPEKSRVVFSLSRYEKMKYKEIADKLDVTVKTVEAHMSRALKILRAELKDYLLTFLIASFIFRMIAGILDIL